MSKYTLTGEDIQAYLATKNNEDRVGSNSSFTCLGANALRHKYGESFYIPWGNPYFHRVGYRDDVPLKECVKHLLDRFDILARLKDGPVTKAEWLTSQEVFFTTQQEKVSELEKTSF